MLNPASLAKDDEGGEELEKLLKTLQSLRQSYESVHGDGDGLDRRAQGKSAEELRSSLAFLHRRIAKKFTISRQFVEAITHHEASVDLIQEQLSKTNFSGPHSSASTTSTANTTGCRAEDGLSVSSSLAKKYRTRKSSSSPTGSPSSSLSSSSSSRTSSRRSSPSASSSRPSTPSSKRGACTAGGDSAQHRDVMLLAAGLHDLAQIHTFLGDFETADRHFHQAVNVVEASPNSELRVKQYFHDVLQKFQRRRTKYLARKNKISAPSGEACQITKPSGDPQTNLSGGAAHRQCLATTSPSHEACGEKPHSTESESSGRSREAEKNLSKQLSSPAPSVQSPGKHQSTPQPSGLSRQPSFSSRSNPSSPSLRKGGLRKILSLSSSSAGSPRCSLSERSSQLPSPLSSSLSSLRPNRNGSKTTTTGPTCLPDSGEGKTSELLPSQSASAARPQATAPTGASAATSTPASASHLALPRRSTSSRSKTTDRSFLPSVKTAAPEALPRDLPSGGPVEGEGEEHLQKEMPFCLVQPPQFDGVAVGTGLGIHFRRLTSAARRASGRKDVGDKRTRGGGGGSGVHGVASKLNLYPDIQFNILHPNSSSSSSSSSCLSARLEKRGGSSFNKTHQESQGFSRSLKAPLDNTSPEEKKKDEEKDDEDHESRKQQPALSQPPSSSSSSSNLSNPVTSTETRKTSKLKRAPHYWFTPRTRETWRSVVDATDLLNRRNESQGVLTRKRQLAEERKKESATQHRRSHLRKETGGESSPSLANSSPSSSLSRAFFSSVTQSQAVWSFAKNDGTAATSRHPARRSFPESSSFHPTSLEMEEKSRKSTRAAVDGNERKKKPPSSAASSLSSQDLSGARKGGRRSLVRRESSLSTGQLTFGKNLLEREEEEELNGNEKGEKQMRKKKALYSSSSTDTEGRSSSRESLSDSGSSQSASRSISEEEEEDQDESSFSPPLAIRDYHYNEAKTPADNQKNDARITDGAPPHTEEALASQRPSFCSSASLHPPTFPLQLSSLPSFFSAPPAADSSDPTVRQQSNLPNHEKQTVPLEVSPKNLFPRPLCHFFGITDILHWQRDSCLVGDPFPFYSNPATTAPSCSSSSTQSGAGKASVDFAPSSSSELEKKGSFRSDLVRGRGRGGILRSVDRTKCSCRVTFFADETWHLSLHPLNCLSSQEKKNKKKHDDPSFERKTQGDARTHQHCGSLFPRSADTQRRTIHHHYQQEEEEDEKLKTMKKTRKERDQEPTTSSLVFPRELCLQGCLRDLYQKFEVGSHQKTLQGKATRRKPERKQRKTHDFGLACSPAEGAEPRRSSSREKEEEEDKTEERHKSKSRASRSSRKREEFLWSRKANRPDVDEEEHAVSCTSPETSRRKTEQEETKETGAYCARSRGIRRIRSQTGIRSGREKNLVSVHHPKEQKESSSSLAFPWLTKPPIPSFFPVFALRQFERSFVSAYANGGVSSLCV